MNKLLSCHYNMDVTMAQQTELDYLIYNDPLGYP